MGNYTGRKNGRKKFKVVIIENDNVRAIFKPILDSLKPLPEVVKITVKSWRNTDKFPCPKCSAKLSAPNYTCETCNVKIKLVMNF